MTDFSPHAILRHPAISDEEVWELIRRSQAFSMNAGPVTLLIEPPGPWTTRKAAPSWPERWRVSERLAGPTYH